MAKNKASARMISKRNGKRQDLKSSTSKKTLASMQRAVQGQQPQGRCLRLPGDAALRKIRKYQKDCGLLIPNLPFQQLVNEIIQHQFNRDVRFEASAMMVLQSAAEAFLVKEFEMVNLAAIHDNRATIQKRDFELAEMLRLMMTGTRYTDIRG